MILTKIYLRQYEKKDKDKVVNIYNSLYKEYNMFERDASYIESLMERPDVIDEGIIIGEMNGVIVVFFILAINKVEGLREGRVIELAIMPNTQMDIEFILEYIETVFRDLNVDLILLPDIPLFSNQKNEDWMYISEHVFMNYPLNLSQIIKDSIKYNYADELWMNKKVIFYTDFGEFIIYLGNCSKNENRIQKVKEVKIYTSVTTLWKIILKKESIVNAFLKREIKVSISQIDICRKLLNSIQNRNSFYLTFADHF